MKKENPGKDAIFLHRTIHQKIMCKPVLQLNIS